VEREREGERENEGKREETDGKMTQSEWEREGWGQRKGGYSRPLTSYYLLACEALSY
jgi:hypothetical protein